MVLSLDEIGRVYSWPRRSGITATRRTRCHGPTLDETTRYCSVVASSYMHDYRKMYCSSNFTLERV